MKSVCVVSHRRKECSLNKGSKVTVGGWDTGNVRNIRDNHYLSNLLSLRESFCNDGGI